MIVDKQLRIVEWQLTIAGQKIQMIWMVWVTIYERLYKLKAFSIVSSFPHKILKVQQEKNLRKDISTSIG